MNPLEEVTIPKPAFCIINVHPLCMFKCKMCYIWQRKDIPMMSSEKIKEFIDTLAEFTEGKADINFVGGEPLLRNDIIDLISVASKRGLRTSLCTNGYLVDYNMAKRLSESGLKGLAISLDSLDEQTHDTLRGMKGSFKRIMQAIDHLACFTSEEFRVNIQTVISQQNLSGLVELSKWVQKSDKVCGVYFMAVVQPLNLEEIDNWHRKDPYRELWPQDTAEMDFVIEELIRLKSTEQYQRIINSVPQLKAFKSYFEDPDKFLKKISCNLGEYALNVDYKGDFSPCFTQGTIGNICQEDIRQLWRSEKAVLVRQKMKQCKKNCNFLINCYRGETGDESELRV